jgi:hypothetical protein
MEAAIKRASPRFSTWPMAKEYMTQFYAQAVGLEE